MHACVTENLMEALVVNQIGKITAGAAGKTVCGLSAMTHCAVADAEHTADQCRTGRQTGCIGAVIVVKADALGANLIHIWGGIPAIAVTAHMVGTKGVDVQKQNSHVIHSFCRQGEFVGSSPTGNAFYCTSYPFTNRLKTGILIWN